MVPQFLRIRFEASTNGTKTTSYRGKLLASSYWLLAKTVTFGLWTSEASMRWISNTFASKSLCSSVIQILRESSIRRRFS